MHAALDAVAAPAGPRAEHDTAGAAPLSRLTFLCSSDYIAWVGGRVLEMALLNMSVSRSNFSTTFFSLTAPGFTREYSCAAGGSTRDTGTRLASLAAFLDTSLVFAFPFRLDSRSSSCSSLNSGI